MSYQRNKYRDQARARARAAYNNAMLKAKYSHEMRLLEDMIGINEDLISSEQKHIGIGKSAGKILGMILGGPAGQFLGSTAGSLIGDLASEDPSFSSADLSQFDFLLDKAKEYQGDIRDYQSLKTTEFAKNLATDLFSTYMSAGGFNPATGRFTAPGDLEWRTFGDQPYEGNILQTMFKPEIAGEFEGLPADFDPGYTEGFQFGESFNNPATDYGARGIQYDYLAASPLADLSYFPSKIQYINDPRYAAVLQFQTGPGFVDSLNVVDDDVLAFEYWETGR
tara:strand:- start:537 stop:1376 length:840 start_codon:yes stop_codon:yes gene_type:complete